VARVGELFRSERLRQGLKVSEIAASIKIRPDLLEAIEAENFERLPGGAYRKSFVRQYAHALGLNEEEALTSFQEQHYEPPVALPPPVPAKPSQALRMAGALAALVAAGFIYREAVSYATSESHVLKTELRHAASAPAEGVHHEPAYTRHAATQGEAARIDQQADPRTGTGTEPGRPVRVSMSVTEPVWISVKCDGTSIFTGTLEGGEVKRFEASSQLTVLMGNAGGLAIQLNEKPLAPLGAHGEIQMVEFTPGGVRKVPRRPAAPPSDDRIPQA
jgi:Helix-turn-helix domain/Domain of unknown function (DUF4115)